MLAMAFGACQQKRYYDYIMDDNGTDKPVIYKDTLASDKRKEKVKKPKRKTFYSIKTRKAFTKTVKGRNVTYELFYILKKPQPPQPFVKDIYWYHTKRKQIIVGAIPEKEKPYAKIMHGPYRKVLNKQTVEEGIFYLGAKHGRWEKYEPGEQEILVDKIKYYKGHSKEAQVAYYDLEKTKVKEVIPYLNGKKEGDYFFFTPAGVLVETGKYENDIKVGQWKEYFEQKGRIKKISQYAPDGFATDFVGYLMYEYDFNGIMVYSKEEEDKKKKK
jgi:antitoxin component YwqK of YwqJK toxin-antitoxin module